MYKYFLLVLKDIHIYMCMYAVLQVFVYSKIGQTRCYQVLVLICLRSITKLRKKYIRLKKIVNITGAWRGAVEWFPKMTSLPPRE